MKATIILNKNAVFLDMILSYCFVQAGSLCGDPELEGLVQRLGGVVHPDKGEHEAQHDDEDVEAHCLPGHHLAT